MKFSTPYFALVLVPLAWLWVKSRARAVPFSFAVGGAIRASLRRRLLPFSRALMPLSLVFLVVASMGPRFGRATRVDVERGIDIELVLDCSSSMLLRDFGAELSRIDVVRPVVRKFVESRPLDRIGLLSFALYPRVACPVTRDHGALLERLDELHAVRPNSEEDSTAIGVALAAAAQQLASSDASSKVIVLLTDGEERVNDVTPASGAEYLATKGIRLYTIAAGRGASGSAEGLDAIAMKTGGKGYVAYDQSSLSQVYRSIDALEKTDAREQRVTSYADAQGAFLLVAVLLVLCDALLRASFPGGAP